MKLKSKNFSSQILITVFTSLFVLSAYLLISSYYSAIDKAESATFAKLQAIAFTLSDRIDGDMHDYLVKKYKSKNDISKNPQDRTYLYLRNLLNNAYLNNNLNTPIYTLIYDTTSKCFSFIIYSGESPIYRHSYEKFPPVLLEQYETGGVIPQYKTENGTWLSAFVPIKNSRGKVVALLQVDQKFNEFIDQAKASLYKNILAIVLVFALIAFLLYRQLQKIINNEEAVKKKLEESNHIIEEKNRDIIDSINYASRIQNAIAGKPEHIRSFFPDSFIIYKPKDIVSGDFIWMNPRIASLRSLGNDPQEKEIIVSVVDCTGHGVPGALMSVIGYSLLNEIIQSKVPDPATMLSRLNAGVINNLNQDAENNSHTHDGMDVALCFINTMERTLQFSGANRPLFWFHKGNLEIVKGDKYPVGGMHFGKERSFTNHTFNYNSGDAIYIFSDGFADQFSGETGKKFMLKQFRETLMQIQDLPMAEQQRILDKKFNEWKGKHEQVDDVSVIGIKLA